MKAPNESEDEIQHNRPASFGPTSRASLQSAALVPAKVYDRAATARVLLCHQVKKC